jgi:hypothetical protein
MCPPVEYEFSYGSLRVFAPPKWCRAPYTALLSQDDKGEAEFFPQGVLHALRTSTLLQAHGRIRESQHRESGPHLSHGLLIHVDGGLFAVP